MPNAYRGEVAFRALGREMFLVYGTQEIAEMHQALGFRRPDPLAKPYPETVPALNGKFVKQEDGRLVWVEAMDADQRLLAKLNEDGTPEMRTVIVNAKEMHRRVVEAFDVAFSAPRLDDLPRMIRIGLRRWTRDANKAVALTELEFERLCDELGAAGLGQLHGRAVVAAFHAALPEEDKSETEDEEDDPNAKSPESASQT